MFVCKYGFICFVGSWYIFVSSVDLYCGFFDLNCLICILIRLFRYYIVILICVIGVKYNYKVVFW